MQSQFKSVICFTLMLLAILSQAQDHAQWAKTPPMGWNSYDCFGAAVTEDEVRGNAKMMEFHLKAFGWEYVVIDYCWYYPYVGAMVNPPQTDDYQPSLPMDAYGRLQPAEDRFPSSAGGKGFKEIADYVHSLGLKFGIHIMRGISREAVARKMPVKGTSYTADQITDYSTCPWLDTMYGVDLDKPGAQAYYNSLFELYAEWGVDYVKVDDTSSPNFAKTPYYRAKEVEACRKAIDRCGQKIVLSLSPGAHTPFDRADHLKENSNLWRISADFWDDWDALIKQFARLHKWESYIGSGHWPDADMIPFGRLNRRGPHDGMEWETRFTRPEKVTLMTLWCIARSPLMYGGDLMLLRPTELRLLTNQEVLTVNQHSANNRQLFRTETHVAWIADAPDSKDKYLGVFNISDVDTVKALVKLNDLGFTKQVNIRDLWKHEGLGEFTREFSPKIRAHGAGLYRIGE